MVFLLAFGRVCTRSLLVRPIISTPLYNRGYVTVIRGNIKSKNPPPPLPGPSALKTHHTHLSDLSTKLRYPIKHTSVDVTREAYDPPLGGTEALPFHFTRTHSNKLPVYSDFKQKDVKREFTIVRKITGDYKEVAKELSLLIPGAIIEERAGSLVLEGHHSTLIRKWMMSLGF